MNFAEINIIMDQHFCTVQNEIYILYICRECWDILRDASSRWHCLMYLLSANKKPSSTCSANQRPGWGHHCHDFTPVMGWEQEVTRGRSKNAFIAKIVLKDDYYCILSPTPHLFKSLLVEFWLQECSDTLCVLNLDWFLLSSSNLWSD